MSENFTLLRALAAATLSFMVLAGGKSFAADADDVKAAVDAYHAAIVSRDIAKVEAVWAHDASVIDKEPIAPAITVGWEGTKKGYEGLFGIATDIAISQVEGPHIQTQGDVAWSAGVSKSVLKTKTGDGPELTIFEADVFQKRDGHWLLVSHMTSGVPN